jgi:SagB-type dehydrogenase family enzyme
MSRPLASRLLALSLALAAPALAAAPPAPTKLPAPRTQGAVSVEAALQGRRSVRSLAATPLSLAEIGQLCWAAQGITDPKSGHRTAPSARAAYPLTLYVLVGPGSDLPAGYYRYVPEGHALALVAAGDRRADFEKRGVGQSWVGRAPAIFVLTGAVARMAANGEGAAPFMMVEAGAAAQGFFLQAEAMKLGSTYVGGFKPKEARQALELADGEDVLGVLPVGHRP